MKYRFSPLPNTQAARRYKVQSGDSKTQAFFNFSKEILVIWGNPLETKLHELMIAYVKKNGWAKEPVAIGDKSPRSLSKYIASLQPAPAKHKKAAVQTK